MMLLIKRIFQNIKQIMIILNIIRTELIKFSRFIINDKKIKLYRPKVVFLFARHIKKKENNPSISAIWSNEIWEVCFCLVFNVIDESLINYNRKVKKDFHQNNNLAYFFNYMSRASRLNFFFTIKMILYQNFLLTIEYTWSIMSAHESNLNIKIIVFLLSSDFTNVSAEKTVSNSLLTFIL